MNPKHVFSAVLMAAFLSLTACGGGGDAPPVADITPDAFTLKDVKDAEPGKYYTASMKVAGLDAAVKARASEGAEFSIDGGKTWRTEGADVENGDEVIIRLKSSDEPGGIVNASLFVGGMSSSRQAEGTVEDNFQVNTKADKEAPKLAVHFPPASGYTDAAAIRVRGKVEDDFEIATFSVNGDAVVPDPDTGEWAYDVTLAAGANAIKVIAEDASGKKSTVERVVDTTSTTAGSGEALTASYQALEVSSDGSTIFYGGSDKTVYTLSLETGERSVLSREPDVGTGPVMNYLRGMSMGRIENELLVADHGHVLAVDTTNGDRTDLSNDSGLGSGPDFNAMQVVSDPVSGMLYVASDQATDKVVSVALPSGDRAIVSDVGIGTGPTLDAVDAVAVDAENSVLFVSGDNGLGNGAIFSVDPETGDRVDVSAGTGPVFGSVPSEVRYWQDANLLLATADDALAQVDPVSGDRSVVSNGTIGNGPGLENLGAMGFHEPSRVAFAVSRDRSGVHRIYAVDVENGDRIVIAAD